MHKTKFTIRVDAEHLAGARQYADRHGTTVSRLVSEFFEHLTRRERAGDRSTPVLKRLTGILPPGVDPSDHHRHLRDKYGF
jgi:hypothetical protein